MDVGRASLRIRERTRAAVDAGRRECAMAMVEFTMIVSLLLILLLGMIEFGVLMNRWLTLSNAVREGARVAVAFRTNCDTATVETQVRNTVINYAASSGITLTPGDVGVTNACQPRGTLSTVNVQTPFAFQILPGLATSLAPTIDLSANSVMRNE